MRNYLALLGWGPPDGIEVRPIGEIVELFQLEDVNPSPAFFDIKKLNHINGEYIRALAVDDFVARAGAFVSDEDELRALHALAPLAQERVKVLSELAELFDWVHGSADDQRSWDRAMQQPFARDALRGIIDAYRDVPWKRDALHAAFIELSERLGVSAAKVQGPLRVPVTGRIAGLPLFELFEWLGSDETVRRLEAGLARMG
jgi:glutamyl-tRNA synthetase